MRTICTFVLALLVACSSGGGSAGAAVDPTPAVTVTPVTPEAAAAAIAATNAATPATGPGSHRRCGWIGGGETIGEQSFVAHAAEFDAIHPKWFAMQPDGITIRHAGHFNDQSVIAAARANHVQIIPLVDQDMDRARLRKMLSTPANRTAHVNVLVGAVMDYGYDGIDIDYEGLWAASDRAPFIAFIKELSIALHTHGKELSMAVPGSARDRGDNAYIYEQLVNYADTIHIMGYDFHNTTSNHMGPLAPLGWIDAVFARTQATGHPERFILGLANYAISSKYFTTTRNAITQCVGPITDSTSHMTVCPLDHYEAGRAPHCNSAQHGTLWFEDVQSMTEKVIAAKARGARGVSYWTVGDELDGFFDMTRTEFPKTP